MNNVSTPPHCERLKTARGLFSTGLFAFAALLPVAQAETARVAAASDLKFAFDELKPLFETTHPSHKLELVMGSSGKFTQQIENGAPFDVFFSADVSLPKRLLDSGKALAPVTTYAFGRIVLWSAKLDATRLTLKDLDRPDIRKIAIASPDHAPYGARAKEALVRIGMWAKVESKIALGENISHTAQLVDMQAAEVGVIALSLALNEQLARKGGYHLIPADLHSPLEQAYVITHHGKNNTAAKTFVDFMGTPTARKVMRRYGFILQGEQLR